MGVRTHPLSAAIYSHSEPLGYFLTASNQVYFGGGQMGTKAWVTRCQSRLVHRAYAAVARSSGICMPTTS